MDNIQTSAFGEWTANTVVADASQISAFVDNGITSLSATVSADISALSSAIQAKVIVKRWEDED